jgi:hypothetical protein
MNDPEQPRRPAGVRPAGVRPAGERWAPIRWVDPGPQVFEVGDRVVVRDDSREWPAEVVVAATQVVEAPPLDSLPAIVGPADAASWPAEAPGAGAALLRSLPLPPDLPPSAR